MLHGHCHQKSIMRMTAEEDVLRRMGVEPTAPEAGCCGMAGAFGFERGEHYAVAMANGERALLPAVRAASADTVIVADGFSCREQIRQATNRHGVHLAEAIQLAWRESEGAGAGSRGT